MISPRMQTTKVNEVTREWLPASFSDLLLEVQGLREAIQLGDSPFVCRGHADRGWLLDSTFVRSAKEIVLGAAPEARISSRIVESADYQQALLRLFLLKFGVLARPSSQLEAVASKNGLDSWFEFMKRLQQYPGEDQCVLKGTNLLDWTQSEDVGLYFANLGRQGDGALFVCNTGATGRTLQTKLVGEILDLMKQRGDSGGALGVPLLFYPPKQIANQRANNQQAVYFAQMEMRTDMESQWRAVEAEQTDKPIVIKLVLPAGTQDEVSEYLGQRGITNDFVFPGEA